MTGTIRFVAAGHGTTFDWANDVVRVKTPAALTDGAVTVVEDTLKPGFHLDRHQHKTMAKIFYVLDGVVEFTFDDETVTATAGSTVNVLPGAHHEVRSVAGARLLTVFTPGGFDVYLSQVKALLEQGTHDAASMDRLGQRFDIWPEPRP